MRYPLGLRLDDMPHELATLLMAGAHGGELGERAVVSFGPEHAALEQKQVERAIEEAQTLVPRPKIVVSVDSVMASRPRRRPRRAARVGSRPATGDRSG